MADIPLDLDTASVGPLKLGDPLESADRLGPPKKVRGSAAGKVLQFETCEVEFIDGRLACAKFDIDEGDKVNVGGYTLSKATKPLDAQVWFGDPSSDSKGPAGLRWIDFERNGATLALEFGADGLNCVQLYADGYA